MGVGPGSLTEAVNQTNASDGTGFDITFNIPGDYYDSIFPNAGAWGITPQGVLTISKKVNIRCHYTTGLHGCAFNMA